MKVFDCNMIPLAFVQVKTSNTAQKLPERPPEATHAYIQSNGGATRWQDIGTPTGLSGHVLSDGNDLWFIGSMTGFRFINDDGESDHDLSITYYKPSA